MFTCARVRVRECVCEGLMKSCIPNPSKSSQAADSWIPWSSCSQLNNQMLVKSTPTLGSVRSEAVGQVGGPKVFTEWRKEWECDYEWAQWEAGEGAQSWRRG